MDCSQEAERACFNRSSDLGTGFSSTKTHSSLSSLDSRLLKKFGLWWFVIDVDIDGPIIGKFLKLRKKSDICIYPVSFGIFENRKTSNIIERNRQNQQPSLAFNSYGMKQTI